ncbi:hypothetical protein SAMN05216436_10631 [bacterium A37T11]|nr:hypothetical protein SAMN05216436_10631 [bacterium A37T11]
MIIAAFAGTLMSAAAPYSFAGTPEEAAKKEAEVLLYSLSASWNEFQHANDAIVNAEGNHLDIEADYQYYYNAINADNQRPAADKEASLRKLLKTYAQKHKKRAAEELIKQKRLVQFMEKRLTEHQMQFKSYKSKYKKLLGNKALPEVTELEKKLQVSANDLEKQMEKYTQTAAQYDQKFEQVKKGFV